VAGNPFVINDGVNGVLFEPGDYLSLYKTIIQMKTNKNEYDRYCLRAKEIFNERFTAEVMTRKVEEVYAGLLGVYEPEHEEREEEGEEKV
jgi:glycosyltransferase involved in cell wall biosynthesis